MSVNITIKQLRKTAAQWATDNPILGDGVTGYETDTGKYKLGDGVTAWNGLDYPEFAADPFANLTFYSTSAASNVSGYSKLVISIDDPDYDEPAVNVSTGAITTTAQLVGSLISEEGIFAGNPGAITITTIGEIRRVSGTGTAEFYYEVYQRNSLGVETLIATSNTTTAISTSQYEEFSSSALFNNGTWTATDRVVIKYYANRVSGGSNPTYEFLFGGSNPVRTLFPISAQLLLNVPIAIGVTGVTGGTDTYALTTDSNGKLSQLDIVGALAGKQNTFLTTSATLITGSWSLVSGLYEQSISNANITATSIVDIIPDNTDFDTIVAAQILPRTDSSSGSVKVYSKNLPTANIGVTLNIWA